jgi:hypothetical protein
MAMGEFDESHVMVAVSLPVVVIPEDPGALARPAAGDWPEAAAGER